MMKEWTLLVTGTVQGVGFRPFCTRLAISLGLSGEVRNTSDGVSITIQGCPDALSDYHDRLLREAPAAATIETITLLGERSLDIDERAKVFSIGKSERLEQQRVLIPADIALCKDCLRELNDPDNRRFRYPFINCTNCGPRFSIIVGLPYDRPQTTMSCFTMCSHCQREYEAPANRRFHAQPNGCFACGPRLGFLDSKGRRVAEDEAALQRAQGYLQKGAIVAVKGIGGFHLACDGQSETAVAALRARKKRPHKPFAIMVRNLEEAEKLAFLSSRARDMLNSPEAPIVLCPQKDGPRARLIAPNQSHLGIMLPYTPLHHLLLEPFPFLVMTSANRSEEPLIADNDEAVTKLASIADGFLVHDRDIAMKIDDSVMAMAGETPLFIRRARGYVPKPLSLSRALPPLLAAGGEMKATFAVTQDHYLFVSHYLGDLKEGEGYRFYGEALRHLTRLYDIKPRFLVTDLHPQFLSGQICRDFLGEPEETLKVQHHEAHFAACLLENGHEEPALGLILDGTGYGKDGMIWGGELLAGRAGAVRRVGRFRPAPLPGGERAILEPWRYALSLLQETFGRTEALALAERLWPEEKSKAAAVLAVNEVSPRTTSCGRLFDATAALIGLRHKVSYDGQAPMELESAAQTKGFPLPFEISQRHGLIELDWRPALVWLVKNKSQPLPWLAASFHRGLAEALVRWIEEGAAAEGLKTVALSGGVWQNRRLLLTTAALLKKKGFTLLVHRRCSPNDESVSLGQAAFGLALWGKG